LYIPLVGVDPVLTFGTSFVAAVFIPVVSAAVNGLWAPYWAPARAAPEISIE
jgi:hypothetical protein